MSDFAFILSSLKSRWLGTTLSVFLTAFGVMLALLVVQFGHHIQNRLSADGQGIDIVVGAKGSPLQLILSSVYHIDMPTGNIPYTEAEKWMKHPQVKTAIPLALGDNWRGFRIIGTTPAYIEHYSAQIAEGRLWEKAFEAVIGASVGGLRVGDEFFGAHGLMAGGHEHKEEMYKVTGVMKSTGTVLDRLILTSLDSVLEIHGLRGVEHSHDHDHHDHHHGHGHDHDHDHEHHHHHDEAGEPEITALLLTTKSPLANINLPRSINRESALQAANPALEMARLSAMLGLGSQSFAALSAILIVIAALSIFAGLAGSLENRMGDLAVLRAIGYSKSRLFRIITLEGMAIVIIGIIIGLGMGLYGFTLLASIITPLEASGATIRFTAEFIFVILAVMVAGLIAAMLPALRASRVDVARQLSRSV
ncbi:MAG: ABC transporter permease [Alphaproteobacteria bacterium]